MLRRKEPKPGETVILKELPAGSFDDLPKEDLTALRAAVGKYVFLESYRGEDGKAEVTWQENERQHRTIWVDPQCISRAR